MTTVRGFIEKIFHASATFSAGVMRTEEGKSVRFRGRFCANFCDWVALTGEWVNDSEFGPQFEAQEIAYALPQTGAGLTEYLTKHEGFKGIGEKKAEKIVAYAKNAQHLGELLKGDLTEFHQSTKIAMKVLENLREIWLRNEAENELRTYLASFGLTMRQIATLTETFGASVVGILKRDPYMLIRYVDGYGFKRVDQIAQRMGIPKDHPGRIDACLRHTLREEVSEGHTWTLGKDLVATAGEALSLDGLNATDLIKTRGKTLLDEEDLVAEGAAVTFPYLLKAEQLILEALKAHAQKLRPITPKQGHAMGLQEDQVKAYECALRHVVSVITGGAGTGKSTVVARLALAFQDAGLSIAACAPTGKAARRIQDLLQEQGAQIEAQTIHRLLHYNGREFLRESLSERYEPGEGAERTAQPGYDVVIVDETSMVDVLLLAALIDRIDFARTRLILVGDHNQLPPVGPGNALRDILRFELAPTVLLTQVHRHAGILKTNCSRVLDGVVAPSDENHEGWIVVDRYKDPPALVAYLRDLIRDKLPNRFGYDPLRDIQVLTPTHKGPLGTKALNEVLQALHHGEVRKGLGVGDKVIQTVNDYELGIMNGTIGYVTSVEGEGVTVEFEQEGVKFVPKDKRDQLILAYALTVHKTQGSEFPCVVLVTHKSHFFASRPLLYTGVTRASQTLVLVGDAFGLRRAASKNEASARRTLLARWHELPQA
ncbi:MAG: AAA family ATPase [Planctomycetes bacterium]|nr:AAA family ATPase [Planctomycetota bacterium]